MFTGIVEQKTKVVRVVPDGLGREVTLARPKGWSFTVGDSVSVQGVCSTVIKQKKGEFTVGYMEETLKKTTCAHLGTGTVVNLERSLQYGARVHGHLVQGHVSSLGHVIHVATKKHQWNITIRATAHERRYLVPKGSITIDGVSLTIAEKTKDGCVVSIIPHTAAVTTLGALKKGDVVNIETDFLLRAYLMKS
jgi:riboflavin synthase